MKHISEFLKDHPLRKTIFAEDECKMCGGTGRVVMGYFPEDTEVSCLCVTNKQEDNLEN